MKQRYEIPLPLDEVKERLRADMQTDWPLGKLLRSVKRPANDRRGLYGQIEGERLWAVMMHGYDMYPKRVFFGTLRAQGDHTILEGGFRYPMQVLLKLAVLLAWILFGIIRIGVYTAPALLCEAALCEHLLCIGVSGRDSLRAVHQHCPRFSSFRCVFAGENVAAAEILLLFYKPLAFSGTMW